MISKESSLSPRFLLIVMGLTFSALVLFAGTASAGENNGKKVGHANTASDSATEAAEDVETTHAETAGSADVTADAGVTKKESTGATTETKTATSSTSTKSGGSAGGSGGAVDKTSGGGQPIHGCAQAEANDGDPYDSTCTGTPSLNGNGGGDAVGRPCAGCVGAADNMNPRGQMPNGTDANNGYECDGNSGVGKTNPAHTGCAAIPPPPPPPPPPPECPEDNPDTPRDECEPLDRVKRRFFREGDLEEFEPVVRPRRVLPAPLPFTGASTSDVALVGLLLIAAGAALVRRPRIRARSRL